MKEVIRHTYMPHEQVRERTEAATKRSVRDYRGFRELARRTHPNLSQSEAEDALIREHRESVAADSERSQARAADAAMDAEMERLEKQRELSRFRR